MMPSGLKQRLGPVGLHHAPHTSALSNLDERTMAGMAAAAEGHALLPPC